ncbi:MAG: hypothetical protein AABX85_04470 [Nanoarchaeota archaeon]
MTVIDLQTIRYINLLDNASNVKTRKCFIYNNIIFFAVPRHLISQAIGPNAINIKRIQEKLGKKIKIISEASGITDAQKFIESIIAPVQFKSLEISNGVITINAGSQSKAALIGRNRRREAEMQQIIKDTFGLELKII